MHVRLVHLNHAANQRDCLCVNWHIDLLSENQTQTTDIFRLQNAEAYFCTTEPSLGVFLSSGLHRGSKTV